MVKQPRNQVTEMHFDEFPDPFKFSVFHRSSFPTDTMLWIKEVEMVESVSGLKTPQSTGGHRFPKFQMLDAKIASV